MPGAAAQLARLRKACATLPQFEEKISHGAPSFFGPRCCFAMFLDNHHNDGRLAAWLAAAPGAQQQMIAEAPETYFYPPYVGCRGWIGVELGRVGDAELAELVRAAWNWIARK
ncbi:MAG: MmcQ/YjbR family DNA-binding protein [Acidobacteria bacterium]|nr:MmcQ/YjbR family DNA-binding protein [Acidobacteriota bacterium]